MPEIYKLDEKKWPLGRLWKATGRARGNYFGQLCLGMYEKWGDAALDVIGKVYAGGAERAFLKGLKDFGIQGKGADAMAMFFVISQTVMGYDMEAAELSEKRAVVRYHSCHIFTEPYPPAAEKICRQALFRFELKAVELLNPKLKVHMTKLRTAGDPYCEWVCELK